MNHKNYRKPSEDMRQALMLIGQKYYQKAVNKMHEKYMFADEMIVVSQTVWQPYSVALFAWWRH